MIEGNAGDLVTLVFTMLDAGGDPVTGAVNGDFSKRLYKRGATDAATVTVAEIGNGDYTATFTPDEAGMWNVVVRHTSTKAEFAEQVGVGLNAVANGAVVAASGSATVYVRLHMSRNGRQVTDATTATVELFDDATGASIGSVTLAAGDSMPDAEGYFYGTFTASPVVVENRTYGMKVSITDPAGTVVSTHAAMAVSG